MSDTNNKQMYAKSISKFPYLSALTGDDLFLISKPVSGSYATYNTKMDDIVNCSKPIILNNVKEMWKLGEIDVTHLSNKLSGLMDGDNGVDINSKITFKQTPKIKSSINELDSDSVVTKSNVESMITSSESFIGDDSQIDAKPNNCTNSGTTYEDEKLMIFNIPANGNDSSKFKNEGKEVGSVLCNKTGHLVVYGWLADKGNVLPQEAWVALCGKIKNGNDDTDGTWTIL